MNTKLIAANLKYLRKTLKLTQRQFSDDFSVSYDSLRKWECGGIITLTTALRYKKRFNVSIDDLCTKDLSINQ